MVVNNEYDLTVISSRMPLFLCIIDGLQLWELYPKGGRGHYGWCIRKIDVDQSSSRGDVNGTRCFVTCD